ncbi:hypothetical protein CYMTET_52293 [Cymbomonas tetramitiformis]|uniref:Uncharacterized protein n=1 Tax=Cymbomonas tetramitiformis TaxID=36881 RepID=A0AAE0BJI8_9CHLO|nr:hypothetical protein CYMTET_52293 [Cymbomonas tetramitiformis]
MPNISRTGWHGIGGVASVVVYTTDGVHRMLILKVPPRKFFSPEAGWEHARRQMAFHDTAAGLHAPGVRYTEARHECFRPDEEVHATGCRKGHRMHFVWKLERSKRDNHPSCYEHSTRPEADLLWRGENILAHFDLIGEYWQHFKLGQRAAPDTTTGTFVLPVWCTAFWWPLLKRAWVLKFYPEGSHLFTSPEWRHLIREDGAYAFGGECAKEAPLGGPCWLCACPRRRRAAEAPGGAAGKGGWRAMPETVCGGLQGTAIRCLGCSPLQRQPCGEVSVGLTLFVQCGRCLARRSGFLRSASDLAMGVTSLLGMRTQLSPDKGHRRGVRDVRRFMELLLDRGLGCRPAAR